MLQMGFEQLSSNNVALYCDICCKCYITCCICRKIIWYIFDWSIPENLIFQPLPRPPHEEYQLSLYVKWRTLIRSTLCVNFVALGLIGREQWIFEVEKSCCHFVCWMSTSRHYCMFDRKKIRKMLLPSCRPHQLT